MTTATMKQMANALKANYHEADQVEKVITDCSFAAAAASAAGSMIPILAVPSTIISCFGAVWMMYVQICQTLGINIKENKVKFLARAALSNMATNLAVFLVGDIVLSCIPGVGAIGSALLTFAAVYLAGKMFLAMIVKLTKQGKTGDDIENMSEGEMKREITEHTPSKKDFKEAKRSFRESF